MTNRHALTDRLQRLARAAPHAFREDTVFRYAVIGAIAALLMLPARFGGHAASAPKPLAPPAPRALGRIYDAPASAPLAAAPAAGPISPGRALESAIVRPDAEAEPDRFGTVAAAQAQTKGPRE